MNFIQVATPQQLAKCYAVKVNEGSGVVVSSLSPDIAYVLTARHVLQGRKPVVISLDGKRLKVKSYISFPKRGHTKDIDCAIIVIEPTDELDYAPVASSAIQPEAPCWMMGYPETRAELGNLIDQIKIQDGTIAYSESHNFVMNATNGPVKLFLNGFSGSGVFVENGGRCELIGIESRVDEAPVDYNEHPGRVACYTINHFQELLASNSLPPLAPEFLSCFSRLRDLIFDLNFADVVNVSGIHPILKSAADSLISNGLPKPFELVEQYGNKLLIPDSDPGNIMDQALWVSLLEFFIICGVVDHVSTVGPGYLDRIGRTRSFLYNGSSNSWLAKLREILDFANLHMDADGVVIISSLESNPRIKPSEIQLGDVIRDIATPDIFSPDPVIDKATSSKLESLAIHHLSAIHGACLVENEFSYKGKERIELMKLFREQYGNFIKRRS